MSEPVRAAPTGRESVRRAGPPPRSARTTGGAALARNASREAKRLAAAVLEVLAGLRTPTDAAQAVGVSVPRYYQIEARALAGLVHACEAKPKGRQRQPPDAAVVLRQEVQRLTRELGRQQAVVRLAQRAVGLPPPAPPPRIAGKKRRRRPVTRALAVAARLRPEADPVVASGPATAANSS